jgi:hypothetical protein
MNTTANIEGDLIEPTMRALRQLSLASQGAVAALVRQLAEREGISMEPTSPRSPPQFRKKTPDMPPK